MANILIVPDQLKVRHDLVRRRSCEIVTARIAYLAKCGFIHRHKGNIRKLGVHKLGGRFSTNPDLREETQADNGIQIAVVVPFRGPSNHKLKSGCSQL